MTGIALLISLVGVAVPVHAGPGELPPHLAPTALPEPLPAWVQPVPRPVNCTPAVIVGAATMVVSAAIFARGFVDDDKPLKTAGAVGETIGAAVLIFGVSRPTCL